MRRHLLLACCVVSVCLSAPLVAQEPVLLTARDGVGAYCPTPQFSGGDTGPGGVPFNTGALTDGNISYDYRTKPVPYCYWQRQGSTELQDALR